MNKAIHPNDPWMVVNTSVKPWKAVESHLTLERAQHATEVLNDHEITNGRKPVYQFYHRDPEKT